MSRRGTGVAVVIPSYQGRHLLPDVLAALADQSRQPDEVVVADDASTDDTVSWLRRERPDVVVVTSRRRRGFGPNANAGVRVTSSERVVVLNSDAVPHPTWLAALDAAPRDPGTWAWGSVLLRPDGTIESAGDEYAWPGEGRKRGTGQPVQSLAPAPYPILSPPGAAPMFRRDAFDDLGGYDERFGMYYEDLDLSLRAWRSGWQAMMVPDALVVHGQSRTAGTARIARGVGRNGLWCAVRHAPSIPWAALVRQSFDQAVWARGMGELSQYCAGRLGATTRLPLLLADRRRLARQVPLRPLPGWPELS